MSYESRVLAFRNLFDEIGRRMPIIQGKTFNKEYVHVDFNKYNHCVFTNCTLVFEFGICAFANCEFSGCKFEAKIGSPASLILAFDRQIRESGFREKHR